MTTTFVIGRLREIFGLVDTLVGYNGRQFTSSQFENFLLTNGIKNILTAPGHRSTDGEAENFVKKSILTKLDRNNDASLDQLLCRFLLDYRNMTHCSTGDSPAKIFFGKQLRTRFSNLKPPTTEERIVRSQYNNVINSKGNRNETLIQGQNVRVRDYRNPNKPGWTNAVIKEKLGPQSYFCTLSHNNYVIKRHLESNPGMT